MRALLDTPPRDLGRFRGRSGHQLVLRSPLFPTISLQMGDDEACQPSVGFGIALDIRQQDSQGIRCHLRRVVMPRFCTQLTLAQISGERFSLIMRYDLTDF